MSRPLPMPVIESNPIVLEKGETASHTRYRADIDGLRAVAVLSVVAFHLGYWWIPGGFVGVDVFFVISGYLISSIIQRELDGQRFSLGTFYAKRICRILPAFVAMALVTSVGAIYYLYPIELQAYSQSLIAAALSVSNVYFWTTAGYFGPEATAQPLLHTWSLAVEEQFYFFLPLLLILAHKRFRSFRNPAIVLVFLVSFSLSCYFVFTHPSATFYLIPTRAWELLLGAILTFRLFRTHLSRIWREVLALTGALLLLVALILLSATSTFPGAAALLPCAGAGLIILAGQAGQTSIGSILGSFPFRFTGQISYSLYLWHWPLIVFQRQFNVLMPNELPFPAGHPYLLRNLGVLAAVGVLAILSWRFIEQPFRKDYATSAKSRVFAYGLGSLALLGLLGGAALVTNGFASRFSPEEVRIASYLGYGQEHFRPGQCFILQPHLASEFDKKVCLGRDAGKRSYLVVGDSTAAGLWHGLAKVAPQANILQATGAGCKPVIEQLAGSNSECTQVIDYIYSHFLRENQVETVILAARWGDRDEDRLDKTLKWLRQRDIKTVVIGPPVEYQAALPRLLAMSLRDSDPGLLDRQRVPRPALDLRLRNLAERGGATYASLYDLLCTDGHCETLAAGEIPLQFDICHYTREGSLHLAKKLFESQVVE